MADVTTAVEAAEAVAQVAAPVATNAGTLDYKKVAIVAGGVVVVGVGTYFCVKAIKKRRVKKEVIESAKQPVVDPALDEVTE